MVSERVRRRLVGVAAGLILIGPTPARSEDWPVLRKGLWEFNRTIDEGQGQPTIVSSKKCVEPGADMREQNERLKKTGCVMTPVLRSVKTYSFEANCKMRGIESRSKTVLTVESDSAYTATIESTMGAMKTRERMVARRKGDC